MKRRQEAEKGSQEREKGLGTGLIKHQLSFTGFLTALPPQGISLLCVLGSRPADN